MIDISNKQLPLRVIFWGYHFSGSETYSQLKHSSVFKIVGLVLPSNREHATIERMKTDAENSGILVFTPDKLSNENFFNDLVALKPDLHFVDSYSKLIPKKIIDITGLGFNLHPGLLPQYRGAHVLNWVLVNGEKESGLSLHVLTDKFDEGPVVTYAKTDINLTDTAFDLDKKLIGKIPELIQSLEKQIKNGKIEFQKQEGKSHHWPTRTPKDGEILNTDTALQAHNKIRAVSYPWNGAFINKNGKKIIIWESFPTENTSQNEKGNFVINNSDLFYVGADSKLLQIKCINEIASEEYKPLRGDAMLKELNMN
jgi:methionyl-tRNA formyltransferase